MIQFFFIMLIAFISLIYGVLIGKYELFPYSLLKSLQDKTEYQPESIREHLVYDENEIDQFISITPMTIDSLRNNLRHILFGQQELNKLKHDTIIPKKDKTFMDISNLERIEQFIITQKNRIKSIGYIFHPKEYNNRLIIYHQGHGGSFLRGKRTIAFFLKKGYTVFSFSMPLKGFNNSPIIEIPRLGKIKLLNHEEFKYLDQPLQYFIGPVITMLNYAESKNYRDISMVGVSGGGWTTTIAAAVDERINHSFPVAGSYPMFVRYQDNLKNYGDFEQTFPELYKQVNYLDLYVLGATGNNRSQTQILNKYDPCCYGGDSYLQYEAIVSKRVNKNQSGSFEILSDTTHTKHEISEWALEQIDNRLNVSIQ